MEWNRPIHRIEVLETDPLSEAISLLKGNVFHVTLEKNLAPILDAKAIFTNENGDQQSAFGNFSNSFFRKRSCVSLFDWRLSANYEISEFRRRCWPLQAAAKGIAIIVMNSEIYSCLLTWQDVKTEWLREEMIVPYVEVGHRGPIPESFFKQILIIKTIEDPDCFAAVVRNSFLIS